MQTTEDDLIEKAKTFSNELSKRFLLSAIVEEFEQHEQNERQHKVITVILCFLYFLLICLLHFNRFSIFFCN